MRQLPPFIRMMEYLYNRFKGLPTEAHSQPTPSKRDITANKGLGYRHLEGPHPVEAFSISLSITTDHIDWATTTHELDILADGLTHPQRTHQIIPDELASIHNTLSKRLAVRYAQLNQSHTAPNTGQTLQPSFPTIVSISLEDIAKFENAFLINSLYHRLADMADAHKAKTNPDTASISRNHALGHLRAALVARQRELTASKPILFPTGGKSSRERN